MITGTVLALLGLDRLIVHVHVGLHRRHILVSEELLQTKWIIAQHQVTNGEGVTENVGTDALLRYSRPLA
jgi:hypothetical protein